MNTVLITGSARGIGFELCRQYAEAGDRVFATCRSPANATRLNALAASTAGRLTIHAMDVADSASVKTCRRSIGDTPIDVLINNAGIWGGLATQVFANMDYDNWAHELNVMAMGPFRVIQAFMPNVLAGQQKKIVTISSQTGAHAYDHVIGYSYASAKAAVNRLMTGLATEFRDRGVIIVPLHPGWVKTEMAGDVADISPEESAAGVRRTIAGMTLADTGTFLKWTGDIHPW
ncbi:MAG: SDR family oxidoreductase [Gammaproteobacteria bacterium]|nr:SDR family oxidoreductase [Gammaproteobacteria bacterium]